MDAEVLWEPSPESIAETSLGAYLRWLESERGLTFADGRALHAWSVDDLDGFWRSIWDYFDVQADGAADTVLAAATMPGATWFPGARVNFAEHILRAAHDDAPALTFVREGEEPVDLSWADLRTQVANVAATLRQLGVCEGDRVVAYLPNIPETVVAFLAAATLGAVWSSCAPDFGTTSVIDRFAQLEPKVLFATDGYAFGGKRHDRRDIVARLRSELPTVEQTVLVRTAFPAEPVPADSGLLDWADVSTGGETEPSYVRVPFDHPLWVLFSSGTTGVPKGIVHGHGGVLLEQLKSGLCLDVRKGDRFLFFSSTAWVVWNMHVCSLIAGATIVLYDGSPGWPDPLGTLRVAAQTRSTILGSGAAYMTGLRKTGLVPRQELDLSSLRHVIVTGSPLPPADWAWVSNELNPGLRLDSACGGTDVATAFIGGSPLLPVVTGEIPGPWLGAAVEAWDEQGRPVIGEVGELVVTKPMPSMPVRFWNDDDGARYRAAYFETYPGVWRHGDWLRVSDEGTMVVSGRSDSTLNRLGVRMGSADIYAVVEPLPFVADSVVLGVELDDGDYWMPLFVVPAEGVDFGDAERDAITAAIREGLSRRHVPDEIIVAPEIPRTLTGKKLEVPLKRLMQGEPLDDVANIGATHSPDAIRWFAEFAAAGASRPVH